MRKHVLGFEARTKIGGENDEDNGLVSRSVVGADVGHENTGFGVDFWMSEEGSKTEAKKVMRFHVTSRNFTQANRVPALKNKVLRTISKLLEGYFGYWDLKYIRTLHIVLKARWRIYV